VQVPQGAVRVRAEFLAELAAEHVVGRQRVGRPARAVLGEHQLRGQRLPERVRGDQGDQPLGGLARALQPQAHRGPVLADRQVALDEPRNHLAVQHGGIGVAQRHSAPQPDRLVQPDGRHRVRKSRRAGHEVIEPEQVRVLGVGPEPVAVPDGLDDIRPEDPAQPGHLRVQRAAGMLGLAVAPRDRGQPLRRHHGVRGHQQRGQQVDHDAAARNDRLAASPHLHRAEHAELQPRHRPEPSWPVV